MPRASTSKYDPAFCDQVRALMAEGKSVYEVANELGVSQRTLYNWAEKHEEFGEAMKDGSDASQGWWLEQGRRAVQGLVQGFNAAAWIFNMKNRFGWRDKSETTNRHEVHFKEVGWDVEDEQ